MLGVLIYRGSFESGMPSFDFSPPNRPADRATVVAAATEAPTTGETEQGETAGDEGSEDEAVETDEESAMSTGRICSPMRLIVRPDPPAKAKTLKVTVPPRKKRQRSRLGRFTLAALLITVGSMSVVDTADWVNFAVGDYLAVSLIVVGVGLAIGTVFGRAYSLLFIGLILVALVQVGSWFDLRLGGGFGDPTFSVVSEVELNEDYRLLAGQLRLDLSDLELTGTAATNVVARCRRAVDRSAGRHERHCRHAGRGGGDQCAER